MAPELVEKEEGTGRQRQRTEEGGDAHAERQLLGAAVAVDVEKGGKFGEQVVVMFVNCRLLRRIEPQHALVGEAREFIPESVNVVNARLCLGTRRYRPFRHRVRR